MKKTLTQTLKEITAIENKYGRLIFRMGLTYLVDVGVRHLGDKSVEDRIIDIIRDGDADTSKDVAPQDLIRIVRCASELAKLSIWDLHSGRYKRKTGTLRRARSLDKLFATSYTCINR